MNKEELDARLLQQQKMYQDNLLIWEGAEFLDLKAKFEQARIDYQKLIEEARSRSVKQTITKGEIYDVFPFEVERYGYKRNGKVIPEVIIHNNCYIHHFDQQERFILKENMSEFLKIPTYFSLYYYIDNTIEYIYGDNNGIYRYQVFYLSDNGNFIGNKTCALRGKSYETYYYENDLIVRSETHHIEFDKEPIIDIFYSYDYLYDKQGKLSQIFCNYPFGGRRIEYSAQKPNFKKLEQRVLEQMTSILTQFLVKHTDEKFTRLGIDSNSPDYLFLRMDSSTGEDLLYSLADWEYVEIGEMDLIDYPLDDEQTEKLLVSIAKALLALVSLKEFKNLFEAPDFKIVFLDHQDIVVQEYPYIRKMLKNNLFCKYSTISYDCLIL